MLAVFLTGNIFSKQLFKTISIWIEVSNLCCDRGGETTETVNCVSEHMNL